MSARGRNWYRRRMGKLDGTKRAAAVVRQGKRLAAAQRRRTEALIRRIGVLKRTITRAFYRLGVILREIQHDKLYHAIGISSFDELVTGRLDMAKTTAYELIAIVDHMPQKMASRLGATKSYELIRYAAAEHRTIAEVAKQRIGKASGREVRARVRAKSAKLEPGRAKAETVARRSEKVLAAAGADAHVAAHRRGKSWRLIIDIALDDADLVARPPRERDHRARGGHTLSIPRR